MGATRVQTVGTYRSGNGSSAYYFDVVLSEQSTTSFRNLIGPRGPIDPLTPVPQSVLDDMNEAVRMLALRESESQAASGTESCAGVTSVTVAIPAGILNTTDYRVVCTTEDGTIWAVDPLTQTTTSFVVTFASTYGTALAPLDLDWAVMVAVAQASATSGALTFVQGDAGVRAVTFTSPIPVYRVILSPNGFYPVQVINKTPNGFSIQIGITLGALDTVTVGYDVFV